MGAKKDLEYLVYKRDDALEHFIKKLKSHQLSDEQSHTKLDTVLRFNHQVEKMEEIIKLIKEKK